MYEVAYKIKHWTYGARECYKRHLICNEYCSNYSTCEKFSNRGLVPPMKSAVLELVKKCVPCTGLANEV